jgi:nucleotide-binding universal stress UspA family protein
MAVPGLRRPPCTAHSCLRQTSDPHLSTACRKPLRLPLSLEPKLAFLSIVPVAPSHTDEGLRNYQADARMRTRQVLTELADNAGLDLRPEFYAEFESGRPVSRKILETADKLRANLVIMGLYNSSHTGIISYLDLATSYDVVCQAGSPVLTVNCSSGYDLRARPTEVRASPVSGADVIRSHGCGAKW